MQGTFLCQNLTFLPRSGALVKKKQTEYTMLNEIKIFKDFSQINILQLKTSVTLNSI